MRFYWRLKAINKDETKPYKQAPLIPFFSSLGALPNYANHLAILIKLGAKKILLQINVTGFKMWLVIKKSNQLTAPKFHF